MSDHNIQVVSNLTGISIHTLRAWEKRYKAVTPERTSTGRRKYSDDEVQKLNALNSVCSLGYNIGNIAHYSLGELNELLQKHGVDIKKEEQDLNYQKVTANLLSEKLAHLMLALEGNRIDIISHELNNLKIQLSPKDLALKIISPLMFQVGQRYEEGKISIAQEHAFSSIVKFHLGHFIYRAYQENRKDAPLYLLTTPSGDHHEFGILLASLLLIHHKKNFFYLGPNMPADALIQACKSINASEIILGASPINDQNSHENLNQYLSYILKHKSPHIEITLGGEGYFNKTKFKNISSFRHLPSLESFNAYLST